jgi:DNA-binding NarL/FixJ family response regulator
MTRLDDPGPPDRRTSDAALRVAIVDDHPMFRMGLAVAIAEMAGIEVAGEAQSADEVAGLVASTAPDVVLLDVRLGDGSGLEVNRWLAAHHPGVRVIMLTMSEDHDTALTALRDGASGYLVKGADPERLEHALRAAAAGDVVLDHDMAQAVTELAVARRRGASGRPFAELTQREFDILELGRGARQPRDRPPARAEPEDGPEPRVQRPRQAQRRRPLARHRAQPPAGARAGGALRHRPCSGRRWSSLVP